MATLAVSLDFLAGWRFQGHIFVAIRSWAPLFQGVRIDFNLHISQSQGVEFIATNDPLDDFLRDGSLAHAFDRNLSIGNLAAAVRLDAYFAISATAAQFHGLA